MDLHARRGTAALIVALLSLGVASAIAAPRPHVSALVSKNTAPYQRALGAFSRAYDGPVTPHVLDFEDDALARIREEKPAVVMAVGAKAAKVAQALELPVVYCMVLDPKGQGIGAPNVVGVPLEVPASAQLAELKRLVPGAKQVGVVFNPARSSREVQDAQAAAQKLGLTLNAAPAGSAADFPEALGKVAAKADALWLLADSTGITQDTFHLVLETAMARKLPLMVFNDEFVRLGALFALSPDFEGAGIEAARLALEIAQGKKPGELTPASPRFNLTVNMATARSLGITLSPEVLKGAVKVQSQ